MIEKHHPFPKKVVKHKENQCKEDKACGVHPKRNTKNLQEAISSCQSDHHWFNETE